MNDAGPHQAVLLGHQRRRGDASAPCSPRMPTTTSIEAQVLSDGGEAPAEPRRARPARGDPHRAQQGGAPARRRNVSARSAAAGAARRHPTTPTVPIDPTLPRCRSLWSPPSWVTNALESTRRSSTPRPQAQGAYRGEGNAPARRRGHRDPLQVRRLQNNPQEPRRAIGSLGAAPSAATPVAADHARREQPAAPAERPPRTDRQRHQEDRRQQLRDRPARSSTRSSRIRWRSPRGARRARGEERQAQRLQALRDPAELGVREARALERRHHQVDQRLRADPPTRRSRSTRSSSEATRRSRGHPPRQAGHPQLLDRKT